MPDDPSSAARFVSLLEDSKHYDCKRPRLVGEVVCGGPSQLLGHGGSHLLWEEHRRELSDWELKRDSMRLKIEQEGMRLVSDARRLTVPWEPVIRLISTWKYPAYYLDALTQAKILSAVFNVPNESVAITAPTLNDMESSIVGAIGNETMIGEDVARKLKYPFNSNFKNTLSSLRKRGVLENLSPGYRVTTSFRT